MLQRALSLCMLSLSISTLSADKLPKPPIVETQYGTLEGTTYKTEGGRIVYAFLSVPYATPPVAELRFKEPQPLKKWRGVYHANKSIPMCYQVDQFKYARRWDSIRGDENCLYLNLYTPRIWKVGEPVSELNVLVFIHGGGFTFGSAKAYKPKYLLDKKDLVFVSINYRLGPFGFLSTEDEVIPGNNGLKDQVLALKWVQENIKLFGGSPMKVTLAGFSAGAASVHLHYLSKGSHGLFQRGISVSGNALMPWVLKTGSRIKARRLAKYLRCENVDDSYALLKCLQGVSAKEILRFVMTLFIKFFFNPFSVFGPVIETAGENPFLSEHPYKILQGVTVKNAPWFTSFVSNEGLYPASSFFQDKEAVEILNEEWFELAPHVMDYNYTKSRYHHDQSQFIKNFYFGDDKPITWDNRLNLIEMFSDRFFLADTVKAVQLHSLATNFDVYFYNFSYRGSESVADLFSPLELDIPNTVCHGDDLPYILGCFFVGLSAGKDESDDKDWLMVDAMTDMWIGFIESGKPRLKYSSNTWIPVGKIPDDKKIQFLLIKSYNDMNMTEEETEFFGNRYLWKDHVKLSENEYVNQSDPYLG